MKTKLLFITSLFLCLFFANAQSEIMYVMKDNAVVDQYNVSTEVDSIIFYNPETTTPPNPSSNTYMSGTIPNAKYIGRWEMSTDGGYDKAYWYGSGIKVNFTGTTAKLEIDPGAAWNLGFTYRIDGGDLQFIKSASGSTIDLTPTPLTNGEHTLEIFNGKHSGTTGIPDEILAVKNLILDNGSVTKSPTTVKTFHLDFIGDSITAGYGLPNEYLDSYGWLIAQDLGTEITNYAISGKAVSDLKTKYFKLNPNNFGAGAETSWDFANYQPDIVVINLGENYGSSVSEYQGFLADIRLECPNAWIVPLVPFNPETSGGSKDMRNIINTAVANLADAKTQVVDGWDEVISEPNGEDFQDFNHPNIQGNQKVAAHLAPILANLLGISSN